MKRTRSLTIETRQVTVIRRPGPSRRARCETCGEVVILVTADEAAHLARVSSRAIYRCVETGSLHFTEMADGTLLICLNSLLK
ncbi:MAG TPA: hypothetical protein VF131_24465 [Blastocatellia bacterium]|nr:hypothetical protein [Blastocatellia bacterium]